ncbi:hypothetical protein HR12_06520 [Microbacterium sp. SUBG005]|nr:hypothetical protein HR12_06520 [Microbacterium sp. SUBG005]
MFAKIIARSGHSSSIRVCSRRIFLFIRRIEELFFNAVPGFLLRFYFNIFRIVHLLECEFTYAV